jgi:hypothetical protein
MRAGMPDRTVVETAVLPPNVAGADDVGDMGLDGLLQPCSCVGVHDWRHNRPDWTFQPLQNRLYSSICYLKNIVSGLGRMPAPMINTHGGHTWWTRMVNTHASGLAMTPTLKRSKAVSPCVSALAICEPLIAVMCSMLSYICLRCCEYWTLLAYDDSRACRVP